MADKQPEQTIINTGTVVGSNYAQVFNVTVTDIDITIEFAYINPRDVSTGQVVSRVTLPKNVGIELGELILMLVKTHENKKGGKKGD